MSLPGSKKEIIIKTVLICLLQRRRFEKTKEQKLSHGRSGLEGSRPIFHGRGNAAAFRGGGSVRRVSPSDFPDGR